MRAKKPVSFRLSQRSMEILERRADGLNLQKVQVLEMFLAIADRAIAAGEIAAAELSQPQP